LTQFQKAGCGFATHVGGQGMFTLELAMEAELRFATIEFHTSPWDAHVSRALLESEGIPAYLGNEHVVWANWPMSRMLGEVRLLVRQEHSESAKETLALRDSGDLEAALMAQFPTEAAFCTQCGSNQFSNRRSWSSVALAVVLLLTCKIIYPPLKQRECANCGSPE
jgi:hypothetical protein